MDEQGQFMSIGTVAASNIAKALELPDDRVPAIEQAIQDEIDAMSAHFTLTFVDISEQYQHELAQIKSAFNFVESNYKAVLFSLAVVFLWGVLVGHMV